MENHIVRSSTLFLKGVIVFIGFVVLAVCAFALPSVIGEISANGYDPILLALYGPAVPFFVALYQGFKLLSNIDKNVAFSVSSVSAFRVIKFCALTISALFALGMPYIFYAADQDDAPGVVAIALGITFASFVIATFAAVLQKLFQNAVDIKQENDLTV